MYPLGNLRIVSDLDNNYIAVLSKDQNEVISNKTAYVLLRKLPALLFGFFKKRRRFFFGVTSYRFFVLKSEYLICYDKQVSEKLQSHHVKDIREYVELANREEIKRVISLGHCTIEKRLVHNSSFVAEIIIHPDSGKAIHMMMNTMEDADIWYSMLLGSRVCVHIDDFEIIGELGQGAFGKVELVRYNKDHVLYALKTVELDNEGSSLLKQFVEERTIMQKLQNCPFIVQLRMAFREDHDLHYVLEYCDCGDLLSYIKAHGPLQEDEIRVIGGCIVSAIGFMHSHHFLHRDIKPENILLTENGIAKVADFGLSKTLSSMKSRAFSFCGTDLYRPPEMSQQAAGYNRALDWWQVGCVLYEMAIGVPPFDGTKEERRRKVLKEEPFYPSTLSTELISLLKGLLRKNAYERLGGGDGDADDIKNTQFFCKMNWTELEEKALCSKGSALGTPSPLRPDNKKQKKNHKKVIDDNDLLGFEYDEKVLSDLTSQLQSYIEMNSNISTCIGLNTISSYGSFVCYIMGNSQAKYNIQPKELKELQETTKC